MEHPAPCVLGIEISMRTIALIRIHELIDVPIAIVLVLSEESSAYAELPDRLCLEDQKRTVDDRHGIAL